MENIEEGIETDEQIQRELEKELEEYDYNEEDTQSVYSIEFNDPNLDLLKQNNMEDYYKAILKRENNKEIESERLGYSKYWKEYLDGRQVINSDKIQAYPNPD